MQDEQWWLTATMDLLTERSSISDEQAFDLAEALQVTCEGDIPHKAVSRFFSAVPIMIAALPAANDETPLLPH